MGSSMNRTARTEGGRTMPVENMQVKDVEVQERTSGFLIALPVSEPAREEVPPFFLAIHQPPMRRQPIAIEVRPREGVWRPFCAAIPFKERRRVRPSIMAGPSHAPTASGNLSGFRAGPSRDRSLWLLNAANPGTPTESYYIWCDELPTELIFGVDGDVPQYAVSFTAESIRESGRKRCSSGAKELVRDLDA